MKKLVCFSIAILAQGLYGLECEAYAVKFQLLPSSSLSIDGGNLEPLFGSFELEYVGLQNVAFSGGDNDEGFELSNLFLQTSSLTFSQVPSWVNAAYNVYDESNEWVAGGFQLRTHVLGTIGSDPIDVVFQWGALDDNSFIGNTEFNDGAGLGEYGNNTVVSHAAGYDSKYVYSFEIYAEAVSRPGPEPPTAIEEILLFIAMCVEDGTLAGNGPGNSAENRLDALINMLEEAQGLIELEMFEEACGQLQAAYERTDGQRPPPDFVTGPAASELATLILELMESLL